MKKCLVIVLSVVFLMICSVSVYAAKYPTWDMTGVVEYVKKEAPEEIWKNGYTHIGFKDGRNIVFDSFYAEQPIETGNECRISYQYSDMPHEEGQYIKGVKCGK